MSFQERFVSAAAGIDDHALAARVGVSVQTIRNWKSGDSEPHPVLWSPILAAVFISRCTCGAKDDPECPVHGCTCSSVAAHLASPCKWGREP